MRAVQVNLSDGTNYTTSINGTDDEIRAYFVGQWFNHGDVDGPDKMVQAVSVDILPDE